MFLTLSHCEPGTDLYQSIRHKLTRIFFRAFSRTKTDKYDSATRSAL